MVDIICYKVNEQIEKVAEKKANKTSKEKMFACKLPTETGEYTCFFAYEFDEELLEHGLILHSHLTKKEIQDLILKKKDDNFIFHFSCDLCDYQSTLKSNLIRHTEAKHSKEKPYDCDTCGFRCSRKDNLKRHCNTQHQNQYHCSVCKHKANTRNDLEEHYDECHMPSKPYGCTICESSYSQRQQLLHHLMDHSETSDRSYNCVYDGCTYSSPRRYRIVDHMNSFHLKITYKCEQCDFTCGHRENLPRHVQAVHQTTSQPNKFPTNNEPVIKQAVIKLHRLEDEKEAGKRNSITKISGSCSKPNDPAEIENPTIEEQHLDSFNEHYHEAAQIEKPLQTQDSGSHVIHLCPYAQSDTDDLSSRFVIDLGREGGCDDTIREKESKKKICSKKNFDDFLLHSTRHPKSVHFAHYLHATESEVENENIPLELDVITDLPVENQLAPSGSHPQNQDQSNNLNAPSAPAGNTSQAPHDTHSSPPHGAQGTDGPPNGLLSVGISNLSSTASSIPGNNATPQDTQDTQQEGQGTEYSSRPTGPSGQGMHYYECVFLFGL